MSNERKEALQGATPYWALRAERHATHALRVAWLALSLAGSGWGLIVAHLIWGGLDMSSNYSILCLSHDPAIYVEFDGHSGTNSADTALAVAREPRRLGALEEHLNCDLLVERRSASPIEIACPGSGRVKDLHNSHGRCYHTGPTWADVVFLRLLWHGQQAAEGTPLRADADKVRQCWTPQRVHRLRDVLGVTQPDRKST